SDGAAQEAAMSPSITTGTRKDITRLDLAFLRDLGWQTVAYPQLLGDFNLDNHRTIADLAVMLQALSNPTSYKSSHGLSAADFLAIGDVNGDLKVTNADLQAFLNLLKSGDGALQSVPEPGSLLLLSLGAAGLVCIRHRSGRNRNAAK